MTAIPITSMFDDDISSVASVILSGLSAVWGVKQIIKINQELKRDKYLRRFKINSKSKFRVKKRIVPYKRKLRNHITMH